VYVVTEDERILARAMAAPFLWSSFPHFFFEINEAKALPLSIN
jgi:hypothetical protein